MEELLKKLSETGIKTLDLVNQGLDKLPAGVSALWEAAVMRAWITGVFSLSLAGIGLLVGIGLSLWMLKIWKKYDYEFGNVMLSGIAFSIPICSTLIPSIVTLVQIELWMMAFAPEQYILSEIMLHFAK